MALEQIVQENQLFNLDPGRVSIPESISIDITGKEKYALAEIITSLGIFRPGFGGTYDPGTEYAFLIWVRDGNNIYIAKKPSRGIPTTNEEYWFKASNFDDLVDFNDVGGQVAALQQTVISLQEQINELRDAIT